MRSFTSMSGVHAPNHVTDTKHRCIHRARWFRSERRHDLVMFSVIQTSTTGKYLERPAAHGIRLPLYPVSEPG